MNNVIEFSRGQNGRNLENGKTKTVRSYDTVKYFTKDQIQLIRKAARDSASLALTKRRPRVGAVRVWMVIDLITSTGLRVAEAADIRCGDIKSGYGQSELYVRDGKGHVSRTIQIPKTLKTHLNQFLKWKQNRNEPTGQDDYLFTGQRGPWKSSGIQQAVKVLLKSLNLYEKGRSVHALRHSYAFQLYRRQRDLRAVQKQLGHAHIQTTTIYADVSKEDIQQQITGLWN